MRIGPSFIVLLSMSKSGNVRKKNMTVQPSVIRYLNRECNRLKNKTHAAQMERYFKNVHPFYGIKSPELKQMIKKVQTKYKSEWDAPTLLNTAEELLQAKHGEKKILGVYLLGVPSNLKLIKDEPELIESLGGFIERYVHDWGTCDGLSSQVVRKLIAANPDYASEVQSWCRSSNDWKQRASCVSFVCLARKGEYNDVIFDIATNVVRNSNRFPQLGVGWLLRELSLADEDAVVDFIKENYNKFTREGLRYAIEKMDSSLRQQLLTYSA